ncbi:hypothetical protein Hanom_Chr04g00317631 [Helianthus anomalus]
MFMFYFKMTSCHNVEVFVFGEEDSGGPTNQSVAIGSASDMVPRSTRRRKRNATTTTGKYHRLLII